MSKQNNPKENSVSDFRYVHQLMWLITEQYVDNSTWYVLCANEMENEKHNKRKKNLCGEGIKVCCPTTHQITHT